MDLNIVDLCDWSTASWHLISDDLHTSELGKNVKVRVTSKEDERMLQDQGCDPHIVRRDRGALLTQLPINSGVVMRRLLVGIEQADTGLQEKTAQDGFVAWSLAPYGKSGAQLSQHDERQPNFIGELDRLDNEYIAPAKVGVTVCVERQLHFHISSSMVS